MGFSDASVYAKFALPWIIVGFVFHVVGFPTNSWIQTSSVGVGIFQECVGSACTGVDHGTTPSWHKVTFAFEVIGFIFLVFSVIIEVCYVIVLNNNKVVRVVGIVCLSAAIFFIFIGFVVFSGRFGERYNDVVFDLSWSFALVVVAYICLFVGLVAQFLDLCIPYRGSMHHRFIA